MDNADSAQVPSMSMLALSRLTEGAGKERHPFDSNVPGAVGLSRSASGLIDLYSLSETVDEIGYLAAGGGGNGETLMEFLYKQYQLEVAHPGLYVSKSRWGDACPHNGHDEFMHESNTLDLDARGGYSRVAKEDPDLLLLGKRTLESVFGVLGKDLAPDAALSQAPEVLRLFALPEQMQRMPQSMASMLPVLSQRDHHALTADSPFSAPNCVEE